MSGMDALLSSLLADPSKGPARQRGPLITEVGGAPAALTPLQGRGEGGPSLMDIMMAEQAVAAKLKQVEDVVVEKKVTLLLLLPHSPPHPTSVRPPSLQVGVQRLRERV